MFVAVGRIGRPHGIKGDVTVEVMTDDPDVRFAPGEQLDTDPADKGPLTVTHRGRSGHITLLRFAGYEDRSAAEALRGVRLRVEIDELPELSDPDDFYDHELIGLTARHIDGRALGTVTDVLHAPASSVLTITGPDGSEELVPFVAAIVTEVDRESGMITIDPPDGMFD